MNTSRSIEQIVEPAAVVEGAGVRLKRSLGGQELNYLDPFLLFDHFGSSNAEDYRSGFPMHPHRGIETVTYMLTGEVHHRDTLGNSGSIKAGDVQWMTAGGGLLHEEMPQVRLPSNDRGFPCLPLERQPVCRFSFSQIGNQELRRQVGLPIDARDMSADQVLREDILAVYKAFVERHT